MKTFSASVKREVWY